MSSRVMFGLSMLFALLYVFLQANSNRADVHKDKWCDNLFVLKCSCSDDVKAKVQFCCSRKGDDIYSCQAKTGSECDPATFEVSCVGTWYSGASCGGSGGYDNCLIKGTDTGMGCTTTVKSCIPFP